MRGSLEGSRGDRAVVYDEVATSGYTTIRDATHDAGFGTAAAVPVRVVPGVEIALTLYSRRPGGWSNQLLSRADLHAQRIAKSVRLCVDLASLNQDSTDMDTARSACAVIDRALRFTIDQYHCSTHEALERLYVMARGEGPDPEGPHTC